IAICDYLENGVVDEFHIYAGLFRQRGVECVVADVRDLRFDGEVLRDGEGRQVDAIWRRCVTNDVIDHWDESQQLIDAVRAAKVALIGSFAGHIVHDKQLFSVLLRRRPRPSSPKRRSRPGETAPMTAFLNDDQVNIDRSAPTGEEGSSSPPTTTAPTTCMPAAR
ncbi:MAG: carboxylate--amine ligase, partial [Eggerthella lenta]